MTGVGHAKESAFHGLWRGTADAHFGANKLPRALEPGRRIYAVGDLHGRIDLLEQLVRLIRGDLEGWRGRSQVLFLGDYVDRGEESAAAIERLRGGAAALGLPEGCRLLCLKGNHEDLFLRAFEGSEYLPIWLANGGDATCLSYGIDLMTLAGDGGVITRLHRALRRVVPDSHRGFLRALPLCYSAGDYFFCHAGVRPGVPFDEQAEEDLLWIREPFLGSAEEHGKLVVHGHTPVHRPEVLSNRICIDTGAVFCGRLTALVLEGETRRFLHT